MKSWPLSVGPGFGTKSGCQILLERILTCQVLESISSGINACALTGQKTLSFPSLTGIVWCNAGRCFGLPWIRAHLMNHYMEERPTHLLFFFKPFWFLPLFLSHTPERLLPSEQEIPVYPNYLMVGMLLICCFFSKMFSWPQPTFKSNYVCCVLHIRKKAFSNHMICMPAPI